MRKGKRRSRSESSLTFTSPKPQTCKKEILRASDQYLILESVLLLLQPPQQLVLSHLSPLLQGPPTTYSWSLALTNPDTPREGGTHTRPVSCINVVLENRRQRECASWKTKLEQSNHEGLWMGSKGFLFLKKKKSLEFWSNFFWWVFHLSREMQQRRRENAAWTTKVDVSGCSYVVTIWENMSLCLTKCIWRLIDFNLFECESLSNSGSVEGQTPSFAFHLRATGSKAIYCLSLFYHKLISQLFMPRLPSVSKWSHKKIKSRNLITLLYSN